MGWNLYGVILLGLINGVSQSIGFGFIKQVDLVWGELLTAGRKPYKTLV